MLPKRRHRGRAAVPAAGEVIRTLLAAAIDCQSPLAVRPPSFVMESLPGAVGAACGPARPAPAVVAELGVRILLREGHRDIARSGLPSGEKKQGRLSPRRSRRTGTWREAHAGRRLLCDRPPMSAPHEGDHLLGEAPTSPTGPSDRDVEPELQRELGGAGAVEPATGLLLDYRRPWPRSNRFACDLEQS